MISKPAHKNTDNPPGQIINQLPTMGETKLGDIIDKVRRSDPYVTKRKVTDEVLEEVLKLAGYCDKYAAGGKFDGYKEAKNKLRTYLENM